MRSAAELLVGSTAEGAVARLGPVPRVGAGRDGVTGSRDGVADRSPDCGEDAGVPDGGVRTAERKRPRPVAPGGCVTVDRS